MGTISTPNVDEEIRQRAIERLGVADTSIVRVVDRDSE
jgi:hypothetical protein